MKDKIMATNLTPNRTIRHYCFHCVGNSSWENVDSCDEKKCSFFKYRNGKGRVSVKTFRKFCLECMNGYRELIKTCTTLNCLVYPYRMGFNPNYSANSIQNIPEVHRVGIVRRRETH